MERRDLPNQIVKPQELVYGEGGTCIGYTYRKPKEDLISLKALFQPKCMEEKQLNQTMLFQIGFHVLELILKLSHMGIYPGLIDLSYLFVSKERLNKEVYLFHPEMFQAETIPSSYPWYPKDMALYEDEFDLFDREKQAVADAKLLYKILTASSKGNVKIPPNPHNKDDSYLYWNLLSREWKEYFLALGTCKVEYEDLKEGWKIFLTERKSSRLE